MKKLSNVQVSKLVERYRNGENLTYLADCFGVTRSAVTGLLKRRNIEIRSNLVKLTNEDKSEIINLYRDGIGTFDLAKKFNVSQGWVWQYVKRILKITRGREETNKFRRIHFFNESYFENIDCPEKAYVLGFIFADGCNTGNRLVIGLARKDAGLLEGIARFIGAQDMVIEGTSKGNGKEYQTSVLTLCSQKMSMDLERHGAVKNKTFRLRIPVLASRLIRHFVRGYFDGDGCMCVYKNRNKATMSIIGGRPFIRQMARLMKKGGIPFIHLYRKSKKLSYLAVTHTEGLIEVYRFLYGDGGFFLERKKNKFREFFTRKGILCPA